MEHTKQWTRVLIVLITVLSPFVAALPQDDYPEFPFRPPSFRRHDLRSLFERMGDAKEGDTIPLLTMMSAGGDYTAAITLKEVSRDEAADPKFTAEVALKRAEAIMNAVFRPRVPEEVRVAEVHGRNFLGQDVFIVEYGFSKPMPVNGAGYPPTLYIPIFQHKKTVLKFLPVGKQQQPNSKKKGK